MMRRVLKYAIEGVLIQKLIEFIDRFIQRVSYFLYAIFQKVDNNKIMFFTFSGLYECNPSFIADRLSKEKKYKLIWACRNVPINCISDYPSSVKLVKYNTFDFYKEAATAKIWIDNSFGSIYSTGYKKRSQTLIQTWHGSLGIKRFDTNKDKGWIKLAKKSAKNTNFIISNSFFETDLYKKTFWKNTEILEYGHARNDIFFDEKIKEERVNKFKRFIIYDQKYKYCLYAPTFRDNQDTLIYNLDYNNIIEALKKKFGGEWKILIRMHFQTKNAIIKNSNNIIDVSEYRCIHDIMPVCDAGITDYSSWICDYLFLKKPSFLICSDYDQYIEERGFLFPLETMPCSIAHSNEELINNIIEFDSDDYERKVDHFIKEKGCIDDGNASQRAAYKIGELLE